MSAIGGYSRTKKAFIPDSGDSGGCLIFILLFIVIIFTLVMVNNGMDDKKTEIGTESVQSEKDTLLID